MLKGEINRRLADSDRLARRLPKVADGERKRLEAKKKRVNNAYFDDAITEADRRRELARIDAELKRLPVPITGSLAVAGQRLASVGQLWHGMTMDERREASRILFEKVAMNPKQKELRLKPWPEFE
ncbi:MAG: hypothetical protein ACREMU_13805, partial [Gemmatimonadaceae bacterium]